MIGKQACSQNVYDGVLENRYQRALSMDTYHRGVKGVSPIFLLQARRIALRSGQLHWLPRLFVAPAATRKVATLLLPKSDSARIRSRSTHNSRSAASPGVVTYRKGFVVADHIHCRRYSAVLRCVAHQFWDSWYSCLLCACTCGERESTHPHARSVKQSIQSLHAQLRHKRYIFAGRI